LPALAVALVVLIGGASAWSSAGLTAADGRAVWEALFPAPVVTHQAAGDGVQFTARVRAVESRVTVSPDGRELWWEIAGAEVLRIEDMPVDDDLVTDCDVLPVGHGRFVVRLQIAGYIGHDVLLHDEVALLNLARSPVLGRNVVIDPGHGGRDPGAVAPGGVREADLTLAVAEDLAARLRVAGAATRLTRDAGTDFSQYSYRTMDSLERAAVANEWPADVYVAIHFNFFESPRYGGTEVWHRGDKAGSERLATLMVSELAALGLNKRGTRIGDYAVLRETKMPAILVELGFLSHPRDLVFFSEPANRAKAAELMRHALLEFFRQGP